MLSRVQAWQNSGSGGVIFLLHGYNANSLVRKYLYVKDTKITGNDINASSVQQVW